MQIIAVLVVPLLLAFSSSSVVNAWIQLLWEQPPFVITGLHWYFNSCCLNPPKILIPKFKENVILKPDPSSSVYSGIPQGTSHSLPQQRQFPPSYLQKVPLDFPHPGPVSWEPSTSTSLVLVSSWLSHAYAETTLSSVISHILAVLLFATFPYLISPSPLCSYSSNMDHTHLLQFCYFLLTLMLLYRLNYKILNCLFYILTLISF